MKQTAALYARVSTHHQEQEATIASQVAAIEVYAESQGYALKKDLYFLDEAVSGAKLDRPGLDRLRDQVSEGIFDAIICLSPDRLARQYTLQILLLEEFRQADIEVVFVNQPPVSDNPQSQLLFGIQGLFAEYERAIIAERMRRGRLHRARQGRMVQPATPYGYRYVPKDGSNGGHWEIEAAEALIVQQIFTLYTQAEPVSIRKIADQLTEAQVPTRQGKRWHNSLVGNILRQVQYTGEAYYNRTQKTYNEVGQIRKNGHGKRKHPIRTPRLAEEWITIRVPAIIDQETWQVAQERMKNNQKFASRNNQQHFFLLRGLLVCGICGHTLIGRRFVDSKATYGCNYGAIHCPPDVPKHACSLPAEIIEPLVWNAIIELLQNPKLISQAWNDASKVVPTGIEQNEKERLENRLKTLERQQERLLDLFQEEQLDKTVYLERKQCLQQQQQTIQDRIQELFQQGRLVQAKQHLMDNFEMFCQRIQTNLDNPTPELQREVIRLLIDHIVVDENEIVIKHIVPIDDDCRLRPRRQAAKGAKKTRILF
jgi:site-specific DNA recombinase